MRKDVGVDGDAQRIVAKVEELMRWCDRLETHLATARTSGAHLLEAILCQVQGDPSTAPPSPR